jgi:hypothetical protein
LDVEIRGKDVNVDKMLAALEARLKALDKTAGRSNPLKPIGDGAKAATPNVLALQQAQARLEVQQGNLAGAAQRLRSALAQQTTTTVQTVNAQRQLLAVENHLASGTSALGAHFQKLGNAVGGLPGQLAGVTTGIGALTAAAGLGVAVVKSFGDAFVFQAQLDATTRSIEAQLRGVRDSGETFAAAATFAERYKLTQLETTDAIAASIGVMRASKAPIEDILGVLARMQVLSPEQSLQEAAVALKALASGDTTSLVTRFEVGRDLANQMKAEIQGGADAVQVMSQFLGDTGIGMDVLKAKTEGASGALKDLAIAQERLTQAQAAFAQGPGLVFLEGKIAVITGATRVLTGDFDAMGQSLTNAGTSFAATAAGANAYFAALAAGSSVAEANAIAVEAQAGAPLSLLRRRTS